MILPVSKNNFYFKSARTLSSTNAPQIIPQKNEVRLQKNKINYPWLLNVGLTAAVLSLFFIAACFTPDSGGKIAGLIKNGSKK